MIRIGDKELINRFITDSNSVPHKVISTFVGNKMIYNTEPVIYNDTNAEFYKRQTANGAIENTDKLKSAIKEVRGKSIVWNQGCKVATNLTVECYGVTLVWNTANNTVTLNGTATGTGFHDGNFTYGQFITSELANHVVYTKLISSDYSATVTPQATTGAGGMVVPNKYGTGKIGAGNDNNPRLNLSVIKDVTYNNVVVKVEYIDLTLMFGAGNEPATVEEFEKMFPLDYYDYNAGEVIPFAGQNLVTTGFNQWDEQWEVGEYDMNQGKPVDVGNGIRSKNFIKVLPNQTYYFHCGKRGAGNNIGIFPYDANFNILSNSSVDHSLTTTSFTTPVNCHYLRLFIPNSWYGSTYNNDICINISNEDRNGTYEPYEKHTLPLDPSQWRDKDGNLVFPYGGMHGVGTAYDYAKVDADGYIRKAVRCFGQVDLGTLTWGFQTETARFIPTARLGDEKHPISNNDKAIAVCADYPIYSSNVLYNNTVKGFAFRANGEQMVLRNPQKTAEDLTDGHAAWLEGVILYYELAEPVEVELATPIYAKYLVDKDGTEEITPANGAEPYTTMATMNLIYSERKDN